MGVIKRQGVKYSLMAYFGAFIGMVNTLYFYPKFLSEEELGLVKFLIETASLAAPLLLIGAPNIAIKFFPALKDSASGNHGFLSFLLTYAGIAFLFFALILFFSYPAISDYYAARDPLFEAYFYALFFICALYGLSTLIQRYTHNFRRIVIPTLIHEYSIKIGTPLIAGLYFFGAISLDGVVQGLILIFVFDLLAQLIYLHRLGGLVLRPFQGVVRIVNWKKIVEFGTFGLLGSLGFSMIFYLDAFMVGTFYSLSGLGIFAIAAAIANVMNIPFKAFNKIGPPLISEAWEKNDQETINNLYKRSSTVLLTSGIIVFTLVWVNLQSLYDFMPNGDVYRSGQWVVFILGMSRLIDLATGLNASIIGYSRYFKFNFYSMGVLAVANIFLNLWLIPIFGINGAALATLISFLLFNLTRYLFIYYRFKMQPFGWHSLGLLLSGILLLFAFEYLPLSGNLFLDIVWRTSFVGLIFLMIILFTPWSPDIKKLSLDLLGKIRDKVKRIK
ncbi:MAG: hypothetical protein EA362_01020 [Saprospirales bacterium]|nr:MAG: hypothetical protein EA362_01020 [Saprospirales bacterium]